MLNHTDKTLIKLAVDKYQDAVENVKVAAKRLRESLGGPMESINEMLLDEAMAAEEQAADDMREIRDGYRYTYPHPAALAPHGSRYPVR